MKRLLGLSDIDMAPSLGGAAKVIEAGRNSGVMLPSDVFIDIPRQVISVELWLSRWVQSKFLRHQALVAIT